MSTIAKTSFALIGTAAEVAILNMYQQHVSYSMLATVGQKLFPTFTPVFKPRRWWQFGRRELLDSGDRLWTFVTLIYEDEPEAAAPPSSSDDEPDDDDEIDFTGYRGEPSLDDSEMPAGGKLN